MPAVARESIAELSIPPVGPADWTPAAPVHKRRVAVVSTAGLSKRDDKPFSWLARDFRAFSKTERDLMMTHVAVDYDRTGWQQDLNTILPLDRLEEMAAAGETGSVAREHYSFMGASDPLDMKRAVAEVAERMRRDNVNTVFLIPV